MFIKTFLIYSGRPSSKLEKVLIRAPKNIFGKFHSGNKKTQNFTLIAKQKKIAK
jgi:hypothetical protein